MLRFLPLTAGGSAPPPSFADDKRVILNGQTDWIDGGNTAAVDFEYTDPFWIGCWVYVHAWHSSVDLGKCEVMGKVLESTDPTNPHRGYHMRVTTDTSGYHARVCFYLVHSFGVSDVYMGVTTANDAIPVNTWVRIDCVNVDGTAANAKIYINGVSQTLNVEKDNLSGTIKNSAHFAFGSRNGAENFLNGSVEDPIIAAFAPTQGDIDAVNSVTPFDASAATFSGGAALCAWWMGDLDTAPTIVDHKGTMNLTLQGSAAIGNYSNYNPDPAFYPTSISSLVNWQDAADPTAYSLSGSLIDNFFDKSNTGQSFTASGSARPTLTASLLNGLPGTVWDGSNTIMLGDSSTALTFTNQGMSVFIVAEADTFSGSPVYPATMSYTSNAGGNFAFGYSNDNSYKDFYWGVASGGKAPLTASAVTGTAHRIEILYNGSGEGTPANFSFHDASTSETVTANAGTGSTGSVSCLGSYVSTGNHLFLGKIYEILTFSSELSGADLTNVRTYLSNKWGV